MLRQYLLAQRILSDDLMVERIAPNEETRLLLGNAIAKFSDKHWTNKNKYPGPRSFYSYPRCTPLHVLITNKITGAGWNE
jgi:hypothetical protein